MSLELFVPALAGYLLLRYSNFTWFGLLRESGHHLVFHSVLVGLALYAAGWIIAGEFGMPSFLEASDDDVRGRFEIGSPGLWTLAIAAVLAPVSNLVYRRDRAEARAAHKSGDFLARLIDRASRAGRTLEITLRDGKTYIGYVTESRIRKHGAEGGALVLVPVLSGYRTPDTHELVLTTGYAPLLASSSKYWTELEIAVPRSEVRRARLFDIKLYGEGAAEFRLRPEET